MARVSVAVCASVMRGIAGQRLHPNRTCAWASRVPAVPSHGALPHRRGECSLRTGPDRVIRRWPVWRRGPLNPALMATLRNLSCLPPMASMPFPVQFNPGSPPTGQVGRCARTAWPHRRSAARQARPPGTAGRTHRLSGLPPGTRAIRRHMSGQTAPAMSA